MASAATSAAPYPKSFRSHSASESSVASMGWTISSWNAGCEAESGAVARNLANWAIKVVSEKSRVHTRRYARLAIVGQELRLYRAVRPEANLRTHGASVAWSRKGAER